MSTKRKILIIDPTEGYGGGQEVLHQVIEWANLSGLEVHVQIPFGGENETRIRSCKEQFTLHQLRLPSFSNRKKGFRDLFRLAASIPGLLKYFRLFSDMDIVYVNGGRFFAQAALLSVWTGIFKKQRIIYHVHLDLGRLERFLLACISKVPSTYRILVNSHFIKNKLEAAGLCDKFSLLENALSQKFECLPFKNRFEKEKLNRIAIIGRVDVNKGQRILEQLCPRFPGIQFFVIGSNDFESPEELNYIKNLPYSNLVLVGKVKNLIETIDHYQIQCSLVPSKWDEPFGLVSIESMAISLLTVVRQRGELPTIASNTGALLFDTDQDLIELVESLLSNSLEYLSQLSQDQFTRTKRVYSSERFRRELSLHIL